MFDVNILFRCRILVIVFLPVASVLCKLDINDEADDDVLVKHVYQWGVRMKTSPKELFYFKPFRMPGDNQTVIAKRTVVPTLAPSEPEFDMLVTLQDQSIPQQNRTFDYGQLKNADICYKIRSFMDDAERNLLVYIAGPGENINSQVTRIVIEAFLKRRDYHILYINYGIPSLELFGRKFKYNNFMDYASDINFCLRQLVYTDSPKYKKLYVHVIGLGMAADLGSYAVMHFPEDALRYPDRMTGFDPMNEKDRFLAQEYRRLKAFTNPLPSGPIAAHCADKVVLFFSNMGQHGRDVTAPGCINILLNEGKTQPGCDEPSTFNSPTSHRRNWLGRENTSKLYHGETAFCSHQFSIIYFAYFVQREDGGPCAEKVPEDGLPADTPCIWDDSKFPVGLLDPIELYRRRGGDYNKQTGNNNIYYPQD